MAEIHRDEAEMSKNSEMSTSASSEKTFTRMETLRDVMTKTVQSFLKHLRLIKPVSNVNTAVLKQLEKEVVSQLESNIQVELNEMYKENNIETLLNLLDRLIDGSGSSADSKTWRPSGVPEQDSHCYVAALKQEKLKYLRSKLENLEAQNKLLQAKVERKEACLFRTKDKIVALAEDFEQTVENESKLVMAEEMK